MSVSLYDSQMSNVENLSPQTIRQVLKELSELQKNAPEGIKVQFNDNDVTDIHAVLEGPGNCRAYNKYRLFRFVYCFNGADSMDA